MKVNIGPYPKFRGRHSVVKFVLDTCQLPSCRTTYWIVDVIWAVYSYYLRKRGYERKISVTVTDEDVMALDKTLSPILLQALIKYRQLVHEDNTPVIVDSALPDELVDVLFSDLSRWLFLLDEMIFAFTELSGDWESQYYHHETLIRIEDEPIYRKIPESEAAIIVDWRERDEHKRRIDRGVGYFGKYYGHLWL